MKSPRHLRDRLTSLTLGAAGSLAAIVLGSQYFAAHAPPPNHPTEMARQIALWLTSVLLVFRLAYDFVLWRLIFPQIDLNGKWTYTHHYCPPHHDGDPDGPMRVNQGWLEIAQNLHSVHYQGSRESRNGAPSSESVNFSSLAFDISDTGVAVMYYEVKRDSTVRSLAEIRVENVNNGFAPTKLLIRFRSLEPEPTYSGNGVYEFVGPTNRISDRLVELIRRMLGRSRPTRAAIPATTDQKPAS
jgi:hypothetical protein